MAACSPDLEPHCHYAYSKAIKDPINSKNNRVLGNPSYHSVYQNSGSPLHKADAHKNRRLRKSGQIFSRKVNIPMKL